jgi:putative glutamine amidotransferase
MEESFDYIAHSLQIDAGTLLASTLGTEVIVTNALHHQAVKDLGRGIVASAWAEDGVIEAIEMPSHSFVVGVQSHPEALEYRVEPRWRHLFAALTNAAAPAVLVN